MVRLITHNLLACHASNCNYPENFPLRFEDVSKIEIQESEEGVNYEFLRGFWHKIDWSALVKATRQLGDESLPETAPDLLNLDPESDVVRSVWKVLMETHVCDGKMVCPACGHVYSVKDGIPNMLLSPNELKK